MAPSTARGARGGSPVQVERAAGRPTARAGVGTTPRLLDVYRKQILPHLMSSFGYTNPYQVPRLTKIVVNMGAGEAAHDAKVLEEAQQHLALITGQKPLVTRAKKAISNFHIKRGDVVGLKVTLRGHRMYEFLDRLVSVALPRIRDFRGISPRGVDGSGNYSLGLAEQTIFPEIDADKILKVLGMDITIVTTATQNDETLALLRAFGMPFSAS